MILTVCHWAIVGLWAIALTYWVIAAFFMKQRADRGAFRRGVRTRFLLFLIMVAAITLARRVTGLHALQLAELRSIPMAVTGAVCTAAGAILAVAARAAIGHNWGTPGMRKTDTDLVTSGPYRWIRHPIYTGILLMMMGTAIGLTRGWWLVTIAAGIYFIYSARAEERYMGEVFPDRYPAYRARTKMLVPFLW